MILLEVTSTGFERVIRTTREAKKRAHRQALVTVKHHLRDAVSYGRTRHLTGGTTADRLAVRSGRLRNAFWFTVEGSQEFDEAHLGFIQGPRAGTPDRPSPLVYAHIHEYGATGARVIRPGPGKQFLTIPTEYAQTKAGVTRARARDFPNTFLVPGKTAPWVIMQRRGQGRNAQVVPLFVLLKQVEIPARPTLGPTWRKFRPMILSDLRRHIPGAIETGRTRG